MTSLTLPWMDKIRQWSSEGKKPHKILLDLMAYGISEEARIRKELKNPAMDAQAEREFKTFLREVEK